MIILLLTASGQMAVEVFLSPYNTECGTALLDLGRFSKIPCSCLVQLTPKEYTIRAFFAIKKGQRDG